MKEERHKNRQTGFLILLREMRKLYCSINCMVQTFKKICLCSRDNMSQIDVISLAKLQIQLISNAIHFHLYWVADNSLSPMTVINNTGGYGRNCCLKLEGTVMKDYFFYAQVLIRLCKIILSDRRQPISTKYHKSHDKNLVLHLNQVYTVAE